MVTRYVCTSDGQDMWEDETGDFVEYEDYAKLAETNRELLEALQAFVDLFPDVIDGDAIMPALDKAEAAITKALGETE